MQCSIADDVSSVHRCPGVHPVVYRAVNLPSGNLTVPGEDLCYGLLLVVSVFTIKNLLGLGVAHK